MVFQGLSLGEKIKIWWKIADTSFKVLSAMPMSTNATVIGPKLISFSTYHSCCPKFNFAICQSKDKVIS